MKKIYVELELNTPGTRDGPGGRDRTLAVKSRKTPENHFFCKKQKNKTNKYLF